LSQRWYDNGNAMPGWIRVRCYWFVGGHRVQRWDVRTREWIFSLCTMPGWIGVRCFGIVGGHRLQRWLIFARKRLGVHRLRCWHYCCHHGHVGLHPLRCQYYRCHGRSFCLYRLHWRSNRPSRCISLYHRFVFGRSIFSKWYMHDVSGWLVVCRHWFVGGLQRWDVRTRKWILNLRALSGW
jgi:hypothetical protein